MILKIPDTWLWFTLSFAVMLLAMLIMARQGRYFYTKNVVIQRFSILDLELALTAKELCMIIKGVYNIDDFKTPEGLNITANKVERNLKGQLYVDLLLYMPATYGSIFLLCMRIADVSGKGGAIFFCLLAWLQVLALLMDVIENIYLLQKIVPDVRASSNAVHRAFGLLELTKWGSALIGAVCGIWALLHFWLSGQYGTDSLKYLFVILIELLMFGIVVIVLSNKTKNTRKKKTAEAIVTVQN